MKSILKNILIDKNDNYNDLINILFWTLFFGKNNLKYVLTILFIILDLWNVVLFVLLLIFPIIKLIAIGLKNIKKFKSSALRRTNFIFIICSISKNLITFNLQLFMNAYSLHPHIFSFQLNLLIHSPFIKPFIRIDCICIWNSLEK